MSEMNLVTVLETALAAGGYDGLCNPELECGCRIGDLCPCDEPSPRDCRPGYRGTDPSGESLFLIHLTRQDAKAAKAAEAAEEKT